ncbi:MAG TPA: hypothetical protein VK203_07250 [Nostocaceae cyanobacterium]|nr:hypothetical protein [Nostocaceae cyanobacterium]
MFSPPRLLNLDISDRQHHPTNLAARITIFLSVEEFGRLGISSGIGEKRLAEG